MTTELRDDMCYNERWFTYTTTGRSSFVGCLVAMFLAPFPHQLSSFSPVRLDLSGPVGSYRPVERPSIFRTPPTGVRLQ